jgi:hypothetical protein
MNYLFFAAVSKPQLKRVEIEKEFIYHIYKNENKNKK